MEVAVRHTAAQRLGGAKTTHRCPSCRADSLVLTRRFVSAAAWGTPVVTEFYDCDWCESSYKFSPVDNRWRVISW